MARQPKKPGIEPMTARRVWSRLSTDEWGGVLDRLAPASGFRPSKDSLKGRCYSHNDQHASMLVSPSWKDDVGVAKCFSCGYVRFDPIQIVKELKRCDYAEAAQWLRAEYPALRRLLSDEALEFIDLRNRATLVRERLVKRGCDLLVDAIANPEVYGDTKDTLSWLRSRGFTDAHVLGVMARLQLIGVVPSRADILNTHGTDSDEYRAMGQVFGDAAHGTPMLPMHTVDGRVGRVRIRNTDPDASAKYIYCDSWDDDVDGHPGFYGMRALLDNRTQASAALPQIRVVEGETSVLSMLAHAIATTDIEYVVAGSGLSSASLEPLTLLGARQLDLIGDRGRGGAENIARWAKSMRVPVTMRVLQWPEHRIHPSTGAEIPIRAKDPDEWINELSGNAWVTYLASPDAWTNIVPWAVAQAVRASEQVSDVGARGRIAVECGSMLHDAHAQGAYADSVAAELGLNADLVGRQLEALSKPEEFKRGDHVEIGMRMLADLQHTSDVALVHSEGKLWRYDDSGLWREVTGAAQDRVLNSYSTRGLIRLKNSDAEGAKKRAWGQVGEPRFFADAPTGVAFSNGFVSIDEGGLVNVEPLAPDHKLRTSLAVDYDPAATAPRFRRFLLECLRRTHCEQVSQQGASTCNVRHVCDPTCSTSCTEAHVCWPRDVDQPPTQRWADEQLAAEQTIELLQEFVGASLSGVATRYQCMVLMLGEGENGKSQFAAVVKALFVGGACASVAPQSMANANSRYALVGARLNLVADIPSRELLDASWLKQLVTGDTTEAKKLYADIGDFDPIAGHLFGTNELPAVADSSHGFWRRQIITQWRHKFTGPAKEPALASRIIREELAGVAAWAIQGAVRLIQRGSYAVPEESAEAVKEWRNESDSVALWVARCTVQDLEARMDTSWLHWQYSVWAKENNFAPVNTVHFGRRLKACGVQPCRTSKDRGWLLVMRPVQGIER